MTLVQGELKLVTDTPENISQVWLRAPKERLHGTGVVTTGSDSQPVKNGVVSFTALPGPLVMVLLSNGIPGSTVRLLVPDKASATLRECIEAVGLADDGTLSALEELALETARIAAQIASADRLEAWASETAAAAEQAQISNVESGLASNHATAAASNARKSESNAKQSEINSKQSEIDAQSAAAQASTAANNVRGELQNFADDAASSAEKAKTSEAGAFEHEVNSLAAAERAEFAAEETIQQVEGDFATRNYADSKAWVKRVLADGEDLNAVTAPGLYGVPTYSIANSLVNKPPLEAIQSATLTVTATGDMIRQEWQKTSLVGQDQVKVYRHRDSTGAWSDWMPFVEEWYKGEISNAADLNDVTTPGVYGVPTYTRANSLVNKPPLEAIQSATLTVTATGGGGVKQRWEKISLLGQDQVEVVRHTDGLGAWSDWAKPNVGSGAVSIDSVRPAMLKQASRLRRGGKVGTAGKTPVCLSFDHGFKNFRDKVLPHLTRLGLPCTVAVNPNTLNVAGESEGVTFADLQSWSLNHGIEIAHHSRSHADATSLDTAGFEQAILSTIPEFKANMPEVIADAYIMPGVSGTGYDGFNAGLPPENWYTHPAGRMILSNFPVVTAAMLGQATPALGEPTQTIDRAGVDITSWAKVAEDKISSLAGTHLGMAVFNHPSKIDNGITSARFVQFLEFLAAERDAGRIEVLTVSGFAYADITSNVRANLAAEWSGNQSVIKLSPMLDYYAGAQVLVETTATSSGDLTMAATSDAGGLNAIVTHAATAGQKCRLVFSIPKTATTITITAPGTNRSARIV